jgi:hypothetical protein
MVGSSLYGICDKTQRIHLHGKKRAKNAFSAIGLRSVVPSRLTGIIDTVQSNTPQSTQNL